MLDLLLLRQTPEQVYESQKKRFKSTDILDKCIELDKQWKEGNLN
jgi:seryl-tRNA synthetase